MIDRKLEAHTKLLEYARVGLVVLRLRWPQCQLVDSFSRGREIRTPDSLLPNPVASPFGLIYRLQ